MAAEFANETAAEIPPSGFDVTDKSSLVTVVWAVNLTAFILVGLIVPVRVIVRCTVTRNFFSDDVLVIIAALFTFAICSLLPIATDLGLGQHFWNIDAERLSANTQSLLQLAFIANTLYSCAAGFTRLSAICSLLRVISHKSFQWVMFGVAAMTSAFAIASVLAVVFQCKPISAAWDSSVSGASCYPFLDYQRASTATGIAIDALLCIFPLPYFWAKKMPVAKRTTLVVLMAAGGLACAAVAIKFAFLQPLSQVDVTYNWTSWVLCSIAECTIGIVIISIPPIIPLTKKFAKRRKSKPPQLNIFTTRPRPRVIRPMATPWKDEPVEATTLPEFRSEFHWLRLEQRNHSRCWDVTNRSSKAEEVLGIAL
ncbi:hypothetical protein CCHL11_07979 [Colletotrichum chlorophyti]|uniref:Rhodopsin domain-containing protein n=1 Tax=Colletotrichum chlorophyti TaxID=708187 RepID=A0A1Q8RM81_9PEZI|nr:hypothetical protein CCHL11_07979 [Colletotrichum chlorophyti]